MIIEQLTSEVLKQRFRLDDLLKNLNSIPAFEGLSEEQINNILMVGDAVFLQSNEYLIRQNALDSDLYILLQGHLMITRKEGDEESYIAEISPIDVVGEASFFTKNPRNSNVISIRDSFLVRLSRDKILTNPLFINFITNLAKINAKRLSSHHSALTLYKRKVKTITLVPAGDFQEIRRFSEKFYLALSEYGQTLIEYIEDAPVVSNEQYMKDFFEKENKYSYIVSVLDKELTDAAIRSINQTDHLLFVTNDRANFQLNKIEKYIEREKKYLHRKEFVLVKNQSAIITTEIQNFMEKRRLNGYYTVINQKSEYSRLARSIIGKSTCLVLGGGGARGFAHLGTIKALLEKKVPIDMIGGTSIGSVVGAFYAKFLNYEETEEVLTAFCSQHKFNKYTIPLVSLFSGRDITSALKEGLGENLYIENLGCRFFCVACNLSQLKLAVFNSGLAWSAIRASFSIPMIFPPVVDEKGEVFVDGCVMNNLPVDQMELINNGGKIIASQILPIDSMSKYGLSDGGLSGSQLLLNKLNPFAEKIDTPNINFIFMKSLLLSSRYHQQQMAQIADFCFDHNVKGVGVLELKSIKKIIEIGYQNALSQIENGQLDR
ncbi:NTE family protein RssA [Legionella massiliensis]|uniref:NTE family protein RssA n=1 Tax=Legionella massiliensis TaxID=1034943 RepID=A0A078L0J0_9GAMM|nr:cyclic nucleotide-binding and patatin-like phospholipase domain-containing protein [Legionella massiliensis]CDZ77564.1 NTE family protein RssA [Legionella massiliensis]CEE13302.1 NTE family protein RssA [Legionella massiliensis]